MGDTQFIRTSTWTRLLGHAVEVLQCSGHNIAVWVTDGVLEHDAGPDVTVLLRPPGGVWTPGWTAPVAGVYRFGEAPTEPATTTVVDFIAEDLDH